MIILAFEKILPCTRNTLTTFSGALTIPVLNPNWNDEPKVQAAMASASLPVKSWKRNVKCSNQYTEFTSD